MASIQARSDRPAKAPAPGAAGPVRIDRPGRGLRSWYVAALAVLVTIATGYGLVADDAYEGLPELVRQTHRAQDAVTLAVVPCLLWAARGSGRGSVRAHLVLLGVLTWLTYSAAHLAIGAPFNPLFPVYVAVLGLSGFAMLDLLVRTDATVIERATVAGPRSAAAAFLTVSAVGVVGLWMSDIAVGLVGGRPANLQLAGLPNPTWVLDLAWIVPVAIGAAFQLWRRRPAGPLLGAATIVMLWVLSVSMLMVTPLALGAGLGDDLTVRPQLAAFTVAFGLLGAIETWLIATTARRTTTVSAAPLLRPGWWPAPGDDR